jgi:hypothetical protein
MKATFKLLCAVIEPPFLIWKLKTEQQDPLNEKLSYRLDQPQQDQYILSTLCCARNKMMPRSVNGIPLFICDTLHITCPFSARSRSPIIFMPTLSMLPFAIACLIIPVINLIFTQCLRT